MFLGSVIVTPAVDLDDIFYVMCSDVENMFWHKASGKYFVELALGYDKSKHPDLIVQDLVAQLNDYEIVKDKNYD